MLRGVGGARTLTTAFWQAARCWACRQVGRVVGRAWRGKPAQGQRCAPSAFRGPPTPNSNPTPRASKFNGVHSLTLYFPETLGGGDTTEIRFIGFKGTFTSRDRRAVEATYEAKPMPADHKVRDMQNPSWSVG